MTTPITPLPDWPRKHYEPGGGDAFLYYAVFGEVNIYANLVAYTYRSHGAPKNLRVMKYKREVHPDVFEMFRTRHMWEQLQETDPDLATVVDDADGCVALLGTIPDPPDLNYLRDVVGLITFFLDQGGVAVYDPQMLRYWAPRVWRQRVFDPAGPAPLSHTVILTSEDARPDCSWFHTRGLRKFGRPDLSVRNVGPGYREAVIDLFTRLIEFQAAGGVIRENQQIRMAALPAGGAAHHAGSLEDPDFNNLHLELTWPDGALSA